MFYHHAPFKTLRLSATLFIMDHDVKTNRNILIAVFAMMLVLAGFLLKFYVDQKKENSSLRIKLLTMAANRRQPTTWQQLTTRSTSQNQTQNQTQNKTQIQTPPAQTAVAEAEKIPMADRPLEDLVAELNINMRSVQAAAAKDLDHNIELAEEIISREPGSYAAYKAKLISMLIKEGKYNQDLDDGEVESVLESMAGFDITTDAVARREAALLSNANNQLMIYQDQLRTVAQERVALDDQLEALDPNSPEASVLMSQRQELLAREEAASMQLNQFQNTVQTSLADDSYLNEEIVEIPFMRALAKNDFDTVEDDAAAFIEQFPTSVSGYYYMIRALEFQGRNEEVPEIIANSQLSADAQKTLQDRLDQNRNTDPKKYWQRLNF